MLMIFLPGAKALTAELKHEHGLPKSVSFVETVRGPNGQAGLICSSGDCDKERLRFDPDTQRWSKRFGKTSLVGTCNDLPVTPASLARERFLPGPTLTLLDGHTWQIPLVRKWSDGGQKILYRECLPRILMQDPETGRFVDGEVTPEFRELYHTATSISDKIFAQLTVGTKAELEDNEVELFVCQLLATNYRVDASIVSHLQLLTSELSSAIVRAALDLDMLQTQLGNWQRRLLSGGMSTGSGETPPTEG